MKGFGENQESKKRRIINKSHYISPEQILNNAFNYHSKGNIQEAEKYYKLFLDNGYQDPRALSNYGIICQQKNNLKKAKDLFLKSIDLYPNSSGAFSNLGGVLKDLGRLEEAEIYTRKATELAPNSEEAHFNLAIILKDLGRSKEAILSIKKAINIDPNFAEFHAHLGYILKDQNDLQEAEVSTRRAIELKPNFAEAYSSLGIILMGQRKLKAAVLSLQKAIEVNPNFAQAYSNLSATLIHLESLEKAEGYARIAIRINPELAEAYFNLGDIFLNVGNFKEAEYNHRKCISLNPDCAEAYTSLGVILYINGYLDLALKELGKARSLNAGMEMNNLIYSILMKRKAREDRKVITNRHSTSNQHDLLDSGSLIIKRDVEIELINELYKKSTLELSKINDPSHGNAKGSDYNLFKNNNNVTRLLEDDLTNISKEAVGSDIIIKDSFFTILGAGGSVSNHNHINLIDKVPILDLGNQKFSLVYYLSIGDQNCTEPGILKLYEPNEDILPYKGMIIIFPARRYHSVNYNGKKDRLIVGINFYSI